MPLRLLIASLGIGSLYRQVIFTLAIVSSLFFSAAFAVGTTIDIPNRSEVQSQLEILAKQKILSPAEKLAQQELTKTLEYLDVIERTKQEAIQLKQQLAEAPAKLRQATQGIDALKDSSADTMTRESLANYSLRQLESRLNETLDDLQSAQEDLSAYSSQLISLQTQPERVQNAMYNASMRLMQIRNQLNGLTPNQETMTPTQQQALLAEQMMLNNQLDLDRKNLDANTTLQDLFQKERDYTTERINQLERYIQLLQEVVSDKRLILSENTAKEAQAPADASNIQNDPLISRELAINKDLSQRLIHATEESNTLVQQNIQIKNWLDRSLQSERNLKEQITVLRGSLLLSRILYQEQLNLPSTGLITNMEPRIADLRLEQFEINQQRDKLFQGDAYIQTLMDSSTDKTNPEVEDALGQIVDIRRELLDQLNKQLGNQLTLAINLQINQQQLISVNNSLQHTLIQQIFWVSSNKPMNWSWLKALPGAIKTELGNFHLNLSLDNALTGLINSLFFLIPMLIMIGVIYSRYNIINRHLDRLASDIGQLKRDSQMHTPKAILLTLVKVFPGVLIILGVGYWFQRADFNLSVLFWSFFQHLALFWLVFNLAYRMLSPNGITERHFMISADRCAHYRRQIVRLGMTLIPVIFWSALGTKSPLRLVDDVIGQIVIVIALALLALFVFPFCRDSWNGKDSHAVRLVLVTVMAATPVILIGLMVAGYFYTTLQLIGRWIDSLYLLFLWNIVYLTAIRGLGVAARRLAYRRAIARRNSQGKEGAEGNEPIEEPPLALDQINQQSLRVTTMVIFLIFATGFYWIWADLITVISYLDSISLWHYTATVAGASVTQAVTLGNILVAFMALVLSYVLTRNLPGLLEVVVLSRLQLRQGTSYAITTILTYLITAVGAVTALSSLGVSWDKLQWLVAALSVGLGFGLQEIFANFVSGLIILFERPVRIGDTITIGNYSGSVSKIRIRATTITDFDRKEVIVPNKAFVTERLINWTLSDTVTRIIIKVGVAYGSDLAKVKEILLQAANTNPRVMHDPEPHVFFLDFGASTLDHELRVYVRELRDRSYTIDELNRTIDKLCRENGINIAFNQLDVYLHKPDGTEVQEVSRIFDTNRPLDTKSKPQ